MWEFIKKNHIEVFLSLICLFLLLWNLDRWFHICPWGVIPAVIAVILEIVIELDRKIKK